MAESKGKEVEVARQDPFELSPWSSFRELSTRFDRMLDEMFRGERGAWPSAIGVPMDITESDDEYVISADLPGVKKNDLTVECREGTLSIRGEKKSEREETREKARVLERRYGAFSRSCSLPSDADPDRIDAKFQDGVLKVHIHKRPEAKPKTVAIKG